MAPEDRTTVSGAIFKIPENVVSTHPSSCVISTEGGIFAAAVERSLYSPLPPPALPSGIL